MPKTIAIIAALDTKGTEAAFLRDAIAHRGHMPLTIDIGVLGEPHYSAEVDRDASQLRFVRCGHQ